MWKYHSFVGSILDDVAYHLFSYQYLPTLVPYHYYMPSVFCQFNPP